MIQNVHENIKYFQFFIASPKDKDRRLRGVLKIFEEIYSSIKLNRNEPEFQTFMEDLIDKTEKSLENKGPRQVRIIKPLDRDFIKVHLDVQMTPGIEIAKDDG